MSFPDRLLDAIARKSSPICVGIDPIVENFPDELRPRDLDDCEACIDSIFSFTTRVLEAVRPYVPIVKFQSAYFEKYLWEGVETYYSLIEEAREMGFLVIGDVKRGDIGSTCEAYASAHLAEPGFAGMRDMPVPDAITVNPFLGLDTLEPFLKVCRELDKGIFVLVRTSNPGSALLQDARCSDGRTVSEMLADELQRLASDESLMGSSGFSAIGAVVGATQAHTMSSLRSRLPNSIFLLPGYGTQGATAEMTRAGFVNARGAVVSASRSILYAHRDKKFAHLSDWTAAVREATILMQRELADTLAIAPSNDRAS
jgi:orotidine-5'-phosphate decarboxylase